MRRKVIVNKDAKTKYFLKEKQMANLILAARDESACPAANQEVKKLDRKYKLKRGR